jgi:hypothetical protein
MENAGVFCRHFKYFTVIWYILWPFGNVVVIWYILPRFGKFCQERSGIPAATVHRLCRTMYIGIAERGAKIISREGNKNISRQMLFKFDLSKIEWKTALKPFHPGAWKGEAAKKNFFFFFFNQEKCQVEMNCGDGLVFFINRQHAIQVAVSAVALTRVARFTLVPQTNTGKYTK